ncbi:MAG TPA: tRNA (adenosine(37)-N6)-dimethylallyltransferase MiaA [Thermoanaerobaculia bacterium]|nr:tRNA (adenosine(37)-N6)-dimethylallyltransferase MiaA [Thermoanaerobaculia bacterium]
MSTTELTPRESVAPDRRAGSASRLIVISGPTGVGKSEIALALALRVGGEIINYDSVQLYRGFDIGSAKPDAAMRSRVPHHLFDVVAPSEDLNAAAYASLAREVCRDIERRGRIPILVGGTGFYLRALTCGLPPMPGRSEGIRRRLRRIAGSERGRARLHNWLRRVDPVSAARIASTDRHRIERALEVRLLTGMPISSWRVPSIREGLRLLQFAITMPRSKLLEALDRRTELMYEAGLIEETRRLLEQHPRSARPFGSIGYHEAVRLLDGESTLQEAIAETRRRTRAYAKRQMTWLRGEPSVHWIERGEELEPPLEAIVVTLVRSGFIDDRSTP